jgi:cytochrome bd-type quinol oxidase subunit 2
LLAGPLLVVAYNAELFGGIVHTDAGFAAAWGAFPLLTSYVAQTGTLSAGSVLAAGGAFALSAAQRSLSTPARLLRRRATAVTGSVTLADGDTLALSASRLLQPLERALRAMSWSIVLLATALAVATLT